MGHAGYEVTVLTVRNHAASEPIDAEILRTAPFRRVTVDLLPGYGESGARVWVRRLRQWLARKAAVQLHAPTMESLGPAAALLQRARTHTADLTIVHNEVPHWVGTQLLAEGRRVAADIEDWHSEDLLPADRRGRPLDRIRQVEQTLLQRAAYTSTTSQALADALHARYGGPRPSVIGNAFPLQPDPRLGPPGQPPTMFWFSQTLGPGRGLEAFLAGWQLTRQPSRLALLGQPHAGYAEALLASLPSTRRAQVSFLPLVPPAELPSVIARHDLGLALEQPAIVNRDLTITNKILQYLNAGLAVVATDTAGQREVLTRAPGAGLLLSTEESAGIVAQLDTVLADRARLAEMQVAARRAAVETYCWEKEEPRLLRLVAQALAT